MRPCCRIAAKIWSMTERAWASTVVPPDADAIAATRPPRTCCPPITTFVPLKFRSPMRHPVCGACACRSNVRRYTFERRDEPPPSARERCRHCALPAQTPVGALRRRYSMPQPPAQRWRCAWRLLHCRRDQHVEGLQGLIVEELLLRLSGAQERDSPSLGVLLISSMLLGKSDADLRRPRSGKIADLTNLDRADRRRNPQELQQTPTSLADLPRTPPLAVGPVDGNSILLHTLG